MAGRIGVAIIVGIFTSVIAIVISLGYSAAYWPANALFGFLAGFVGSMLVKRKK